MAKVESSARADPTLRSGRWRWAPTTADVALAIAELLVVAAVTVWLVRPYLNFDPDVVPVGREYLSNIQTHYLWTRVASCGWCALWNGSFRGGYPAFADPHGSMLHPLVMVTTLAWGVSNGAKLALAGAFFMAGLAQWWLGSALGCGRIARTWSATMAVVAGHLAGKMEAGNFGLVLSTAAASLVLPPLLAVGKSGGRRPAVALGIALALTAVSGQGYMQVGIVLLVPLVLLVVPWQREHLWLVMRRLALSGGIALLLAAPFLIPWLHFLPQFGKDTDPAFRSAQPLAFIPLNLVINDTRLFSTDALGKLPFPYLYIIFVGWLPVLLAMCGVLLLWTAPGRHRRPEATFLLVWILAAFWLASATPLSWLAALAPRPASGFVAGLRYLPLVAALAVPALLALAGSGVDQLLATCRRLRWRMPRPTSGVGTGTVAATPFNRVFEVPWLLAVVPLLLAVPSFLAVSDARAFSAQWVRTQRIDPGVPALLQALRTPDLQWVNPPFGEQFWIEPALRLGLKLNLGTQGWYWIRREPPEPVTLGYRGDAPPGLQRRAVVGGVPVYDAPPGREYATVTDDTGGRTICTAQGIGGQIDVRCDLSRPGLLTVKENGWSGWRVQVDGVSQPLGNGPWLSASLPAGQHVVAFRYAPWDVAVGLALGAVGVALVVVSWWPASIGWLPAAVRRRAAAARAGESSAGRLRRAAESPAGRSPLPVAPPE